MAPCSVSVMPICFMPSSSSSRKFTDWSGREGYPTAGRMLGTSRPANPEWTRIRRGHSPKPPCGHIRASFLWRLRRGGRQGLYKEMFVRVVLVSLFGLFTDGRGEKAYDVGCVRREGTYKITQTEKWTAIGLWCLLSEQREGCSFYQEVISVCICLAKPEDCNGWRLFRPVGRAFYWLP